MSHTLSVASHLGLLSPNCSIVATCSPGSIWGSHGLCPSSLLPEYRHSLYLSFLHCQKHHIRLPWLSNFPEDLGKSRFIQDRQLWNKHCWSWRLLITPHQMIPLALSVLRHGFSYVSRIHTLTHIKSSFLFSLLSMHLTPPHGLDHFPFYIDDGFFFFFFPKLGFKPPPPKNKKQKTKKQKTKQNKKPTKTKTQIIPPFDTSCWYF